MRVALLSYRSKPHCGGQGVYVRHLSRELVRLGHDVEVFSGPPYPDLDVSHVYERVTEKVVVSVDTQYGDASFSVNGGPPEAIPSTIWVAGEGQNLEVVEALPQLVLR